MFYFYLGRFKLLETTFLIGIIQNLHVTMYYLEWFFYVQAYVRCVRLYETENQLLNQSVKDENEGRHCLCSIFRSMG